MGGRTSTAAGLLARQGFSDAVRAAQLVEALNARHPGADRWLAQIAGAADPDLALQGVAALDETGPEVMHQVFASPAWLKRLAGVLGGSVADPLGIDVGYVDDSSAAAEKLEVDGSVFGAMQAHFGGPAAAFAYMLLILLYTPCVAALGAMRHEIGGKWTAFATVWTTVIGYLAAVSFYQAATFAAHPASSARWLIAAAVIFLGSVTVMWMAGRAHGRRLAAQPAE